MPNSQNRAEFILSLVSHGYRFAWEEFKVRKLIDARAIDFISFTGSVEGGRQVYQEASARLLDMGLELGGKVPGFVCEDANFDFAVANLVDGAFYNCGQSYCAIERIYVMRSLFPRFVEAYVAEVEKYKVGNPEDPETTIGPLAQTASDGVKRGQLPVNSRMIPRGAPVSRTLSWCERPYWSDIRFAGSS